MNITAAQQENSDHALMTCQSVLCLAVWEREGASLDCKSGSTSLETPCYGHTIHQPDQSPLSEPPALASL